MSRLVSISIVGSGRLAHAIAGACMEANIPIKYVCGRNPITTQSLAEQSKGKIVALADLPSTAIVLLAVRDNAIVEVVQQLPKQVKDESLIIHLSGASPLKMGGKDVKRPGVLWPIQSFSGLKIDFPKVVPIVIDANSKDLPLLSSFAKAISDNVQIGDDETRLILHIAAVFANNFSNFMLDQAWQLVQTTTLNWTILEPIMQTTLLNAFQKRPQLVQSGPAQRGDSLTIERHLNTLAESPAMQRIYAQLSKEIMAQWKDS